ncbi:hypothetical protein WMY93_026958 [Mugilogobius chulae]|uniref:C-type lectin domain-containing protein n=1 Tax=Mugilogobius chulae TaxID=88201 RepID=A0AAW0N0K6_9GOBI
MVWIFLIYDDFLFPHTLVLVASISSIWITCKLVTSCVILDYVGSRFYSGFVLPHCVLHLSLYRCDNDLDRRSATSTYKGDAWIGLFDDTASWKGVMGNDSNSWRWSATGNTSTSQYQNWDTNEPNYSDAIEECVLMRNGFW